MKQSSSKKIRLAIDMRMMKPFPTGVGSHFFNLTTTFVRMYPNYEVTLIINKRGENIVRKHFEGLSVAYEMINVNGGSFKQYVMIPYLWWRYKRLPVDLLLTDPWCVFPFLPKPYVMMVYDLIGFHHVARMTFKQILFDKILFKISARRARGIIATLISGKRDVIHFLGVSPKRVYVVEAAVAPEYREPVPDVEKILASYNISGKKYIVYIGNRRAHKNLMGALDVFAMLHGRYKQSDLYFYLIGGFDTDREGRDDLADALDTEYKDIKDHVIFLGKIASNTDVAAIVKGAVALLHPSKFEGFGLTPLEAMSVGTPVVASSIDAIADVVQDAGMLSLPDDVSSHAKYIYELLSDRSLYAAYKKKGLERARAFSWEKSAEKLSRAIDSCAKN